MGRKKFKKNRKGGFFAAVANFFWGIGWVLWKLLPVAILLGLLALGGYQIKKALYADNFLKVQEIRVVPPDALSAQSIRTLEEKLLGKNIFLLDLKKIAAQIDLGPGARSVRVVREMPAKVRIEIQKRNPTANVQLKSGGPYAVVSEDGVIIDVRKELDPAWILVMDYSEPAKEPKIGNRLQNQGFFEALRFVKAYRENKMSRSETLTRITLDPYGSVIARLGEGPDFQMGRNPVERIPFLAQAFYLFEKEPRENIEYMNLEYDRISLKRKK